VGKRKGAEKGLKGEGGKDRIGGEGEESRASPTFLSLSPYPVLSSLPF